MPARPGRPSTYAPLPQLGWEEPDAVRPPLGSVPHPAATQSAPGGAGAAATGSRSPKSGGRRAGRKGHRETQGGVLGILREDRSPYNPCAQSGICSPSLKEPRVLGALRKRSLSSSASQPALTLTGPLSTISAALGSYGLFVPQNSEGWRLV